MTHVALAFSMFYSFQVQAFRVAFAILSVLEPFQAQITVIENSRHLLAVCPLGGRQGISHHSRTELTKVNSQSSHLELLKHSIE